MITQAVITHACALSLLVASHLKISQVSCLRMDDSPTISVTVNYGSTKLLSEGFGTATLVFACYVCAILEISSTTDIAPVLYEVCPYLLKGYPVRHNSIAYECVSQLGDCS